MILVAFAHLYKLQILMFFGATFGIEYDLEGARYVRPASAYEVACCFRVDDDLTHSLSHPKNFVLLDCGIPSATSRVLLDPIIRRLEQIRTENFEILQPVMPNRSP